MCLATSNFGEIQLFYVWKHQHLSRAGQSFADAIGMTSVARGKDIKRAVLFREHSLDQMPVFSRCHWFYTTQGSCKYLNSRVLTLIE